MTILSKFRYTFPRKAWTYRIFQGLLAISLHFPIPYCQFSFSQAHFLEWEFLSDCAFSSSLPTCTFLLHSISQSHSTKTCNRFKAHSLWSTLKALDKCICLNFEEFRRLRRYLLNTTRYRYLKSTGWSHEILFCFPVV